LAEVLQGFGSVQDFNQGKKLLTSLPSGEAPGDGRPLKPSWRIYWRLTGKTADHRIVVPDIRFLGCFVSHACADLSTEVAATGRLGEAGFYEFVGRWHGSNELVA
jgi:hypothetical protein